MASGFCLCKREFGVVKVCSGLLKTVAGQQSGANSFLKTLFFIVRNNNELITYCRGKLVNHEVLILAIS
jgi:hypothetical protein